MQDRRKGKFNEVSREVAMPCLDGGAIPSSMKSSSSSPPSLRSSPLAHLLALLTSSVGGGSSCTGSTTGGSSPLLASLTNCVDGALGLVDNDDDNVNATKNKDEDELIVTKASVRVANDGCTSNNDQHKGTYVCTTLSL